MEPDLAIEFGKEAIWTCLLVAAPALVVGTVLAIILGVLQSMTHLQDQTISFVPKLIFISLALILCLPWCTERLIGFSRELLERPRLIKAYPAGEHRRSKPSRDLQAIRSVDSTPQLTAQYPWNGTSSSEPSRTSWKITTSRTVDADRGPW